MALADALIRDLRSSPHGKLVATYYLVTLTVAGILVGVSPLLPLAALGGVAPHDVLRAVDGVAWFLSACILGVALERIGPTAKLFHARFALENGHSLPGVVGSMFGSYLVLALPIGIFVTLGSWLVTGTLFVSPLAIAIVVAAAETTAECLVAPLPSTDGTKTFDMASSVLGYALMSPCSAVLFLEPAISEPLVFLYAALLIPGALLCLRLRLIRLSSSSTRSPRAMTGTSQSSAT